MRPRTSPLQKIPTRQVKAKHSLKSKLSTYSSNKSPVSLPRYVTSMYPTADINTKRAMVSAIERFQRDNNTDTVPSPIQCKHLFVGLID